jgi:hypothetical protein
VSEGFAAVNVWRHGNTCCCRNSAQNNVQHKLATLLYLRLQATQLLLLAFEKRAGTNNCSIGHPTQINFLRKKEVENVTFLSVMSYTVFVFVEIWYFFFVTLRKQITQIIFNFKKGEAANSGRIIIR